MYVCMYLYVRTYVFMYVCMNVSTFCTVALIIIVHSVASKARMQRSETMYVRNERMRITVCMYVCMNACMHVCMYACMCVCILFAHVCQGLRLKWGGECLFI